MPALDFENERHRNCLCRSLDTIVDGIGYKVADFTTLVARIIGSLSYALYAGWKLTLVFLSVSPLIIITFNASVIVNSY